MLKIFVSLTSLTGFYKTTAPSCS